MHDLRSRHAGFGIEPSRGQIRCLQVTLPTAAICAISIDAAEQPERRRIPALGRKSFSGWSGLQQADKNLALIKPGPAWKGPQSPSASSSLTADAATHSLRHDRRQVCAALLPVALVPKFAAEWHATLGEVMDKDVVARWKRSNRTRGRRLYFRRSSWVALSDGTNNTARWARHRPKVPTAPP